MIKQYQVNALDAISRLPASEILSRLSIPTPDILDYLIEVHTRSINAGVRHYTTEHHIALWTELRQKLIEARALFGTSLSDLEHSKL